MKKLIIIAALATFSLTSYAQRMPPKTPGLVRTDTLNILTTYQDDKGKWHTKEVLTLCSLYRSDSGEEQWIYGPLPATGIKEYQITKRVAPKAHITN